MASLWNDPTRKELLARVERLTPDTPARWGKFTCSAMLAHVNDALRMPLGEVAPASKKLPIRHFPLKQLFIYLLPFPRGLPTAPELLARSSGAVWADEVKAFRGLVARLALASGATVWPSHPAFGAMSRGDWGVLGYRHVSHHFTQFGV
jgi:hypothetical protein